MQDNFIAHHMFIGCLRPFGSLLPSSPQSISPWYLHRPGDWCLCCRGGGSHSTSGQSSVTATGGSGSASLWPGGCGDTAGHRWWPGQEDLHGITSRSGTGGQLDTLSTCRDSGLWSDSRWRSGLQWTLDIPLASEFIRSSYWNYKWWGSIWYNLH